MADVMWFSARREGEICRLRWADNNSRTRIGLVRDLKHPTHKIGNHRRFRYTQEDWQIVMRQPRAGEFIFPYKVAMNMGRTVLPRQNAAYSVTTSLAISLRRDAACSMIWASTKRGHEYIGRRQANPTLQACGQSAGRKAPAAKVP